MEIDIDYRSINQSYAFDSVQLCICIYYIKTFFLFMLVLLHSKYILNITSLLIVFHVAVKEAIQLNKNLSGLNKRQESEICSLKKVWLIQIVVRYKNQSLE